MKKSLFVIAAALISTAAFAQENDHDSRFERNQPDHRAIASLQAVNQNAVAGNADSESDRTQLVYTGKSSASGIVISHEIGNDRN